ncbi:acetylornithine deacetylase [Microvirga subterranea]|uniref:Acetylornithine deacetylase n=1 Tax=Microvirga subterranea TaxID=186651 RepID=A0A370HDA8_9HYPH|nr:acetylornithine deacetylase [Microvirga subterranea]RDI54896.1 acetylornithine deacetylase [Microvirga subterranea]
MPTDDLVSLDLIRDLVGFDTTSRNSNLELIGYIRDYLGRLGIESTLVFDDTGQKASLYATIGPKDRGGILLSGHTDTVPVDGQDWTSDPFTLTRRGDHLYGRGTADMKSFVAIALAFAPDFAKADLTTPIHYAFSYDEEVGCVGVRPLIAHLNTLPVQPRMAIIGEPTEMQIICAHKGKLAMRCRVEGLSCHSSLAPKGVNAVEYAADVVSYLRSMARRIATEGPFDEGFDIPHTTVHTGVIRGGTALNIVPKECTFDFEFRYLPQQDPAALLAEVQRYAHEVLEPEMKAAAPGAGFSWQQLSATPGLDVAPEEEVVTLAKAIAGQNGQSKVAFATEASLFQKSGGIPAVVCGPGNIAQAHKPDEYIALSEVAKGEAFMRRLLATVTA